MLIKVTFLILSGFTFDHRYTQGSGDIWVPRLHPVRLKKSFGNKNAILHQSKGPVTKKLYKKTLRETSTSDLQWFCLFKLIGLNVTSYLKFFYLRTYRNRIITICVVVVDTLTNNY